LHSALKYPYVSISAYIRIRAHQSLSLCLHIRMHIRAYMYVCTYLYVCLHVSFYLWKRRHPVGCPDCECTTPHLCLCFAPLLSHTLSNLITQISLLMRAEGRNEDSVETLRSLTAQHMTLVLQGMCVCVTHTHSHSLTPPQHARTRTHT